MIATHERVPDLLQPLPQPGFAPSKAAARESHFLGRDAEERLSKLAQREDHLRTHGSGFARTPRQAYACRVRVSTQRVCATPSVCRRRPVFRSVRSDAAARNLAET